MRKMNIGAGLGGRAALLGLSVTLSLSACSNANQRTSNNWQPAVVERPAPPAPMAAVQDPLRTSSIAPKVASFTPPGQVQRVPGVYKIGKPYTINGVTYVPSEDPNYDRVGMASWYGPDFHGKQTANGEQFDMDAISAAHPTLPLPSYVHVTNLRNGRTMIVRVNDRGPYKPGRIIDLSRRTAQLLGFDGQGVTEIRVRYAGLAPIDPRDDRRERQHLAAQPWHRMASAGWGRRFGLGFGSGSSSGSSSSSGGGGPAP